MHPTQLAGLNLNVLVALDALLEERNVTRAARRVRVSQPAMSQSLARLRELFDDPLLVRKGRNMVLTPRAEAMLAPLSDALASVERAVQLGMGFDPSTSTRVFRVALPDLTASLVLPKVLCAIAEGAPGIRVQAEALSLNRAAEKLSSASLDLVLAVYLGSADGLRTEALRTEDYVCLVRRGHPLARRKRVRLSDYADYGHVAYTPVGFIPRAMSEAVPDFRTSSSIRASVPYLLALPDVVRSTGLVATVPRSLLSTQISLDELVVLAAPEELPNVVHSMWWHPRFDSDRAHRWLRDRIRDASSGPPGSTVG